MHFNASQIKDFLQKNNQFIGWRGQSALSVSHARPIHKLDQAALSFCKTTNGLDKIAQIPAIVLLPEPESEDDETGHKIPDIQGCWIFCRDPRLAFALVLQQFFEPKPDYTCSDQAYIDATAQIDKKVAIECGAVIKANVSVAAHCQIGAHAVLHEHSQLGESVRIGAGSKIGASGFGYQRDHKGTPQRFPQLGRVLIGAHCEIGENVTINRAALEETIIEEAVMIDDQVYVAHNVRVGQGSLIMAGVRIMGSASIGKSVDIHPGAMIGQGVKVGDKAVIGMGSVVLKEIPADTFAAGIPARIIGSADDHRLS